jgi:spore coat polysaccharide biosynthesis protein SpsF
MEVGQFSKMNIGIIIQARMGSERLPGKVLKEIDGKTLLQILLDRIKPSGFQIVVATTTDLKDDILVDTLKSLGVNYYRGSEDDVLSRYYESAKTFKFDAIIRLTADNPFVDADFVSICVAEYQRVNDENGYLFTEKYPLGIGLEIFSFKSLSDAYLNAKDIKEREHVTPYIISNKQIVQTCIAYKEDKEHYRLTIDTDKDFELASTLILNHQADKLGVEKIIACLDEHQQLLTINSSVHQKKWQE